MPPAPLHFLEITRLHDDLLEPWLDLFQRAFPLNEQVPVRDILHLLKEKERGQAADQHLLAVLDETGTPCALAWYEVVRPCEAGALWYLAVEPAQRSRGIGAACYGEIVRRLAGQARALLIEVEIPEQASSPAERALAARRIRIYQRQGALLLNGIHYLMDTGWQPPLPMHLMAHPLAPLDAAGAFALARCVFGEAVSAVGELALV